MEITVLKITPKKKGSLSWDGKTFKWESGKVKIELPVGDSTVKEFANRLNAMVEAESIWVSPDALDRKFKDISQSGGAFEFKALEEIELVLEITEPETRTDPELIQMLDPEDEDMIDMVLVPVGLP